MTRRWMFAALVVLLGGGWTLALTVPSFATHMVAHVAAVAVAAPLLALALPRRPQCLSAPIAALAACAVELVVVWGWHTPALHAVARADVGAFVVEQLCFLAAGYAVWASALPSPASPWSARAALTGVGALLVTSMHMTLLGGLLTVSSEAWYPHGHAHGGLEDQHLGGAIMLGVGGLAYLIGALGLLASALHEASRSRHTS